MKKKTKSKAKKKTSRRPKSRSRKTETHYSVGYLAVVVVAFILLEVLALGSSTVVDWQESADILDMTGTFEQTANDVVVFFQPPVDAAAGIFEFYQIATDEAMVLLDASETEAFNPMVFVDGVNEWYRIAASEMSILLDDSSRTLWFTRVAEATLGY